MERGINMAGKKTPIVFRSGRKIYLRPPLLTDVPIFVRWMNDQHLQDSLIDRTLPVDETNTTKWVKSLHERTGDIILVIARKRDNVPIGRIGLYKINTRDRRAESGTFLAGEENRGKGYGFEAKMLMIYYGFEVLNLRKITAEVLSYNESSITANLKCGFRQEGLLRSHVFKNGRYHDVIQLAVFRRDWLKVWRVYQGGGKL